MAAGIADAPQAVQHAILVGDFGFGGAVPVVENLLHAAGGVGVEHEDLAEVRARGLEQVEAVALGLGERLFVAEDDLLGVVVQLAEGDKAAPLLQVSASRNLELLRVGEDAGILLLDQNALLTPGAEIARGSGVDAFAPLGVKEFRQAQNDADQIVRAALVVGLLHGGRDFVVGLGDHVTQLYDAKGCSARREMDKCWPCGRSCSPIETAEFALGIPILPCIGDLTRLGSIVSQRAHRSGGR